MKYNSLIAIGCLGLVTAESFFKLDFDINRGNHVDDMDVDNKPQLVKRDAFTMEVTNQQTFYLAQLELGSNKDKVGVLVDTGSSDLWVMSHDVECLASPSSKRRAKRDNIGIHVGDINIGHGHKLTPTKSIVNDADPLGDIFSALGFGTDDPFPNGPPGTGSGGLGSGSGLGGQETNSCTSYGSFATGKSSSYHANNSAPQFEIEYADGTEAVGSWGYDDVTIANTTVNDLSLAVVNITSSNIGVLGIGLPGLEVTFSSANEARPYQYENLPIKLVNQGVINKAAYSLYLGDSSSKRGSILFGAVDNAKYSGTLKSVPIVNSLSQFFDTPLRLEINVDDISINSSSSSPASITSNGYAALLDTGSTLSYFPDALFRKTGRMLGLSYSNTIGAFIIDCNVDSDISLTFDFSGAQINAPLSDFVLQATRSECYLGILSQGDSSSAGNSADETNYILLGDNFLRNAYVVYDLDDLTISLAQAKYTSDEDIEVISSSIPNAQVISSATTGAFTGGSETGSATRVVNAGDSNNTNNSDDSGSSNDSNNGQTKAGAGSYVKPSVFLMVLMVFICL